MSYINNSGFKVKLFNKKLRFKIFHMLKKKRLIERFHLSKMNNTLKNHPKLKINQ
jgi:hypothetical protein